MSNRVNRFIVVAAAALTLGLPVLASAQDAPNRVLFTNVNIFDGTSETLQSAMNVLVEGNLISQISSSAISASGATVIDGGGGTLMPGLIEAHSHLSLHGDLFQIRNDFNWM